MFQVYCVRLIGERFSLLQKDSKTEFGFFHNEYVLAFSKEKAIGIAKIKTLQKLKKKKDVLGVEEKSFEIRVDEVNKARSIFRLLREEGFIFYEVGEDGVDS